MSLISERFADELMEKEMRDAYLAAQTRAKIAHQIRALRVQRGWSQHDFGEKLGKPQSNVSRLESLEEGKYTLQTLLDLASALDVGLSVEFVPYEDFLRRTSELTPGALEVQSFSRDALSPLCQDATLTDVRYETPLHLQQGTAFLASPDLGMSESSECSPIVGSEK